MRVVNADYNGASAPRGLSPGLWGAPGHMCPFDKIRDEQLGLFIFDDFHSLDTTDLYVATQATAGTFALDDAVNGVALADCGSTTNEQGINVQRAGGATVGELFKPAAGKPTWFEARIKIADIGTNTAPEFFLGLCVISTTIISSGANTSANHIGFETTSGAEELKAYGEKAGVRSTPTGTSHTIVDDTWFKVGFFLDGLSAAYFFVNGVHDADEDLTATNIPVSEMVPSLVCQSNGTVDPIVHMDWWAICQLTEVTDVGQVTIN